MAWRKKLWTSGRDKFCPEHSGIHAGTRPHLPGSPILSRDSPTSALGLARICQGFAHICPGFARICVVLHAASTLAESGGSSSSGVVLKVDGCTLGACMVCHIMSECTTMLECMRCLQCSRSG